MDWQKALPCPHLSPTTLFVARLQADPRYSTEEARHGPLSPAARAAELPTLNHARKLPTSRPVPSIPLAHRYAPAAGTGRGLTTYRPTDPRAGMA